MAINTPHGEKAVQRPSSSKDENDAPENARDVSSGAHQEASLEDFKDNGTMSSLSSQENLPSALSSPYQFSPLPSPNQNLSSCASSSQLDSPLPSRLSSTSSLQSPPPSLPSPYLQSNNISIEQLNELALQDSENNNVDENSNQGFDQYAEGPQELVQDQSVRPRVRALHLGRDQPDRAPINYEPIPRMRRRSSSSGSFSHRRNLSEDLTCSPTTSFSFEFDDPEGSAEYHRLPRRLQERRDSRTGLQPLPSREDSIYNSITRILPQRFRAGDHDNRLHAQDDAIEDDARDLLDNFTFETLHMNRLPNPGAEIMRQGYRNPALNRVGQELRRLADAFAETEERRKVQSMAENVHLESINMENFFQLCTELFKGGITWERIVALFTFVGDVAVYHVRHHAQDCLQRLMLWSGRYLVDHICRWVKEAGGWGALLSRGANALYNMVICISCIVGTIAAGVFIAKTVKDW